MPRPCLRSCLLLLPLFLAGGCAAPDYQPEWSIARPMVPGYLHGVGRCGETERPGRARELAIQRAMAEICYQTRGKCEYEFELEEKEDGVLVVHALLEGRRMHSISDIRVMAEKLYPAAPDGYSQDTLFVLVRVPRAALPW